MAFLVLTNTEVLPGGGDYDDTRVVFNGATAGDDGSTTPEIQLTGGMAVYLDQVANQWRRAQADTLAHLGFYLGRGAQLGIVQNAASNPGQKVSVYKGGGNAWWDQSLTYQGGNGIVLAPLTLGTNLAEGESYFVSPSYPGRICEYGDLVSGNFVAKLGTCCLNIGPITYNPSASGALGVGLIGQIENYGVQHI